MTARKKPNHQYPEGPCPNCGTVLTAQQAFCPTCGQQNHTLRLGFFHFIEELLEGLFHFDGKFFGTVRALFWAMPGRMTSDFLAGKRVRFVSPVRLYVFVSIFFFFMLNRSAVKLSEADERLPMLKVTNRDKTVFKMKRTEVVPYKDLEYAIEDTAQAGVAIGMPIYAFARLRHKAKVDAMAAAVSGKIAKAWRGKIASTEYDSAMAKGLKELKSTLMQDSNQLGFSGDSTHGITLKFLPLMNGLPADKAAIEQLQNNREEYLASLGPRYDTLSYVAKLSYAQLGKIQALAGNKGESKKAKEDVVHSITRQLSISMFLLMPVVALLLWFVFRKSRHFYAEHLIFSINAHTTAFLIFGIALSIIYFLPESSKAAEVVLKGSLVANAAYFYVALKQVYGRRWGSTFWRFAVLGFAYLVLLGIIFLASTLQGLLTF